TGTAIATITRTPAGTATTPTAIATRTATTGAPTSTPTSVPAGSVTATATPSVCAIGFGDVPVGSAFYTFIRCLACRGVVSGYADGSFRPGSAVTRGQLSKIVSNSAGYDEPRSTQAFEDVPTGHPFYRWIERLALDGIVSGYTCGGLGEPCVQPQNRPYFRANADVTRGQSSKIVANTFFPGCQVRSADQGLYIQAWLV